MSVTTLSSSHRLSRKDNSLGARPNSRSKSGKSTNTSTIPSTSPSASPPQHLSLSTNSLVFPDPSSDNSVHVSHPAVLPSRISQDIDFYPPPLRYSGSSATTQPNTPPDTPSTPVQVVTVPVSGVETMDALVDGLNTFDPDDVFTASSLQRLQQKTRRKSKSNIHRGQPDLPPPLPSLPSDILRKRPSTAPHTQSAPPSSHTEQRTALPTPSRIPRPKKKDTPTGPCKPQHSSHSTKVADNPSSDTASIVHKSRSSTKGTAHATTVPRRDSQPKAIIPSISDIIKTHAPAYSKTHFSRLNERTSEELVSRSSIDTIAEEVQRTLRAIPDRATDSPPSHTPTNVSHPPLNSPSSSVTRSTSSAKGNTSAYDYNPGPISQAESIATYLRSPRLTSLVKLPRPLQPPLQVSFSDLGDPNGRPLVVFLGLGSVRYLMGLYDEMAEILGLRLITIDRWGLGRTSGDSTTAKGIKEWARIVADILSRLGIEHCSLMAHSAGAPYALSFASLRPECVKGDICLLAPWVGGGENTSSYKWLKYVPSPLLKTAQAAEWRMQTWMLGKPPTVNYRGIGFDRDAPNSASTYSPSMLDRKDSSDVKSIEESLRSSEYDDLADFEGRFESRSTLTSQRTRAVTEPVHGEAPVMARTLSDAQVPKRRTSKGLFTNFLSRSASTTTNNKKESTCTSTDSPKGAKLKSLRSIGSLKGSSKSGVAPSIASRATTITSPALPPIGLGFSDFDWPKMQASGMSESMPGLPPKSPEYRSRRSISLTARRSSERATLQRTTTNHSTPPAHVAAKDSTLGYQAALANALIAASHAEASRGVHSDLVQILNHDGRSWGFSYHSYPHKVRVWYGDKDERIAESAVRWMEKTMTPQRCEVKVIKGADHALMYKSGVVVEVLETVRSFWS